MRILMISPYPPMRDGIANYAVQTVARLFDEGHEVEALSPWPSAAHHHADLRDPAALRALSGRLDRYHRVILQFQPEMFRTAASTPRERAEVNLALAGLVRAARQSEIRVHEFDYTEARADRRLRRSARKLWRAPHVIDVHTERERADLVKLFGVKPERVRVVEHGADFRRRTEADRDEARAALGLPREATVFVAIGFIQPHKGFDRAVRAFAGLERAGCRLDVVGSLRVGDPHYLAHLEELRGLVASTPGAHLHERYVSDEEFDRWLVAADVVVLPYREIWSSGVMERASLYGRPVIASSVGGLPEQAAKHGNVTLVDDDRELAAAMRAAAGGGEPEPEPGGDWGPPERQHVMEEVRSRAAAEREARAGAEARQEGAPSVRVAGYLSDSLGVGQAARLYLGALQAVGVPVSTLSFDPDPPGAGIGRAGREPFAELSGAPDPDFNLICVNGDQLPRFAREVGDEFFAGRRSIGVWAWETDVLPPGWAEAAGLLDEIWVNSRFMAENLGRELPIPVVPVPPPVTAPPSGEDPIGLEDFTFLFMLDFLSTLKRKNPLGLIEAFTRAFEAGEGPRLLIKTINAEHRPVALRELEAAAAARPDIQIVDRYLSDEEKGALLERCGCYVSLHRSEGFGLTLAEAMALGKPVIATGYSGNLDFMGEANGWLVDYRLTEVGAGAEMYPAHGHWAEPDVDHAARLMRQVVEEPDLARAKAERARRDIAERLSPAVTGAVARSRLERLAESRPSPEAAAAPVIEELDRRIAFDLRQGIGSGRGRLMSLPRRILLRLMLPFTVHERRLDEALVQAVREVKREIDAERAAHDRDRARLRMLEARLRELESNGGSEAGRDASVRQP